MFARITLGGLRSGLADRIRHETTDIQGHDRSFGLRQTSHVMMLEVSIAGRETGPWQHSVSVS